MMMVSLAGDFVMKAMNIPCIFLLWVICGCGHITKAAEKIKGLEVYAKMKNEHVRLGDAVVIIISVKNVGTGTIALIQMSPARDYEYTITNEMGESVPLTLNARQQISSIRRSPRRFTFLKSGQEYTEEIRLDEIVSITEPGRYFITIKRIFYPGEKGYQSDFSGAVYGEAISKRLEFRVLSR